MVSGVHLVRARKIRYYPATPVRSLEILGRRRRLAAKPDDWPGRTPIPPSVELRAALKHKARDPNGDIRRGLPQLEDVVISAQNPYHRGTDNY